MTEGRRCLRRRRVVIWQGRGNGRVRSEEMIEEDGSRDAAGNGPLLTSFSQVDDVAKAGARGVVATGLGLAPNLSTTTQSAKTISANSGLCKRMESRKVRTSIDATVNLQVDELSGDRRRD